MSNPNLDTFFALLPRYPKEKRPALILAYYKEWKALNNIRKQFTQGNYAQAYDNLLHLIRKNRNDLLLDYRYVDNTFVQTVLNTYRQKNHAVIRNSSQLINTASELRRKGKFHEAKILERLAQKIKYAGMSLLLIDDLLDRKKLFWEVSHEFNAWISSGCPNKKLNFSCILGDWRRFLPKVSHRTLDQYLWGRGD